MSLPHDTDTEAALIGWCLAKPGEAWRVLDNLSPADFYRPAWSSCAAHLSTGHRTAAELADLVDVDPADLVSAIATAPFRHDLERCVERVANLSARRRLILVAQDAIDAARDPAVDLSTPTDALRSLTTEIERPTTTEVTTAGDFLEGHSDAYDWIIPGLLERGDRLLLTAGEGVGKSNLLRFMALSVAAGLHPFRRTPITPQRVLLVDVENQERKVRRELRPWLPLVEGWDPDMLAIEVKSGGLNLDYASHRGWLAGKVAAFEPAILVIGPLYQLHGAPEKPDIGGENHARNLAHSLDRLRERYGCALLMETHAPHGSMGSRDLRPFGSSLWLRWPEFGIGLRLDRDQGAGTFKVVHWRGPRDPRDFPTHLSYGQQGGWPWIARYETTDREEW